MPYATTDDNVRLYYEDTGAGDAMVFVHEFAGDHRQWEPQVRYFSRRYRCVTFDARGYPSRTCRKRTRSIRKTAPATTSRRSPITSASSVHIFSAIRWSRSRRCF